MSGNGDKKEDIIDDFVYAVKDNLDEIDLEKVSEFEYDKYVVINNKGTNFEDIYGIFEYEIDAYRRCNEIKVKKKMKNTIVIKADVEFAFIHGIRFIVNYEEVVCL